MSSVPSASSAVAVPVGASFTAAMAMSKLSDTLSPPASVATTVTLTVPLKFAGGVPEITPASLIDSQEGAPSARLRVRVASSTSVKVPAGMVKVKAVSSVPA